VGEAAVAAGREDRSVPRATPAILLLAVAGLLGLVLGDSPVATVLAVGGALALGATARPSVIATTGVLAAAGLTGAAAAQPHRTYTAANDFVWFALAEIGMPALVGRLLATRRAKAALLRARAAALAEARDRRAALAELEERLRLSSALDVGVAQRVGEIAVRAGGAQQIADREPGAAPAALEQIEATARAILIDIRELLGWLRTTGEDPAPPPQPLRAPEHDAVASDRHMDAILAAVLFVAFAIEALGAGYRRGAPAVNVLLIAVTVAPLAFRRSTPLAAAAGVFAGLAIMDAAATPLAPLVTPVALLGLVPYSIGAHAASRRARAGLVLALAGGAVLELLTPAAVRSDSSIVAIELSILAAWASGRWVRRTDRGVEAALAEAESRAAEHAIAERLAVARERARVARDLHDVIAHAMTAVVLQAGAARRVWAQDRAVARTALAALAGLAAETLGHLGAAGAHDAPLGRSDVVGLVDQARANGLDVALHMDAPPATAEAETVACRTIQEALTNVARHAAGSSVAVRLQSHAGGLLVEVADEGGRPAAALGAGHGLRGMRERVEACGGHLEAGPRPAGGFLVRAVLPL
jgi:signal transduction histidine kinase